MIKWFRDLPTVFKFLIPVCLVLALASLITAVAMMRKGQDASGWWQVTIEIIAVPAILYGLFELRKAQWKPEIVMGIVAGWARRSDIRAMEHLPERTTLHSDKPEFSLIVRNAGRLVAQSVKIRFEIESADPSLDRVDFELPHPVGPLSQANPDREYPSPFPGTPARWDIYAKDDEVFKMTVIFKYRAIDPKPSFPFCITLRCVVYADGLDAPSEQALTIRMEE